MAKTRKVKDIKILVLAVGKPAEERMVKNDLKTMQELVGGFIENYRIGPGLDIWCNEEGKLKGLKPNIPIAGDVILGDAFLARTNKAGDLVSLTTKDIALFLKTYESTRFMEMSKEHKATIKRWLSDPTTWVGVFQNMDLSSRDVGRKVCLSFDIKDFDRAVIGKDKAPEFVRTAGMLEWQCLLIAKCKTLEEVEAAMKEEASKDGGESTHSQDG